MFKSIEVFIWAALLLLGVSTHAPAQFSPVTPGGQGGGGTNAMYRTNNLADLASVPVAVSNLGLATAVTNIVPGANIHITQVGPHDWQVTASSVITNTMLTVLDTMTVSNSMTQLNANATNTINGLLRPIGGVDAGGTRLINVGNALNSGDAVNLSLLVGATNGLASTSYVDGATNGIDVTAKTLAGNWTVTESLTTPILYAEYISNTFLHTTNLILGSSMNANGFNITNLLAGTAGSHAVNLSQLIGATNGLASVSYVDLCTNGLATVSYVDQATNNVVSAPQWSKYPALQSPDFGHYPISNALYFVGGIDRASVPQTNCIQVGNYDGYNRMQFWIRGSNSIFRMGALGQDGDPYAADGSSVTTTEGAIFYGPRYDGVVNHTNWMYLRLKPDRIGINQCWNNTQNYIFRIDGNEFYFKPDNSSSKSLSFYRSNGNLRISGIYTGSAAGLTNMSLSGLAQGAATTGQVVGWNGTSWAPATIDGMTNGLASTSYVDGATNGLAKVSYVDTVTNGLASQSFVTSQGYVTQTVTNGLAGQDWVTGLGYVTQSITNGLAAQNWVTSLGYVTQSVTNGLAAQSYVDGATNGLATETFVTSQGYVTQSVTNGLASQGFVTSQGYVTATVTNGLASVSYVDAATNGCVSASITNGLASTSYVDVATNGLASQSWVTGQNYVTAAVTNGLASQGWVTGQNYVTESVTNGLASQGWVTGLGYVTATVTNGLASQDFVTSQGYVTQTVTNGLASQDFVTGQGYVTQSVTNGLASTNWVAANFLTPAATNGIDVSTKTLAGDWTVSASLTTPVLNVATITNTQLFSTNANLSGHMNAGGFNITNLAAGTSGSHAVNLSQLIGATNGLATETFVTSQGYVTQTVTNGLASQDWVTGQNYVTATVTNGLASQDWVTGQNYVTQSITNGLASQDWVTGLNYVTQTITNGLASQDWVTGQNYVTQTITNGLASQDWVTGLNYVTAAVTNGLASIGYVDGATNGLATETFVTSRGYVTQSVTNGLASTGYVDGATNGLATVAYVNLCTNGLVTASVTNGLASIGYVDGATNGLASQSWVTGQNYVTQSVTNGLASQSYVNGATNGLATESFVTSRGYVTNTDPIYVNGTTGLVAGANISLAKLNDHLWQVTASSVITNTMLTVLDTLTVSNSMTQLSTAVTNKINGLLMASGGIDAGSQKIINVAAGTGYGDVATYGQLVDATNGLATVNYVNGATNGLATVSYVDLCTNGLSTVSYVDQATNGLATVSYVNSATNGLATVSYVDLCTNGLVTAAVTNGLASQSYVTGATNGLATVAYVDLCTNGLVTASVTNGLASLGYVDGATNGLATVSYVDLCTNGLVTAAVTNGLASQTFVTSQGYVTQSVTNGLASQSYVTGATNGLATNDVYYLACARPNRKASMVSASSSSYVDVVPASDLAAGTCANIEKIRVFNTSSSAATFNLRVFAGGGFATNEIASTYSLGSYSIVEYEKISLCSNGFVQVSAPASVQVNAQCAYAVQQTNVWTGRTIDIASSTNLITVATGKTARVERLLIHNTSSSATTFTLTLTSKTGGSALKLADAYTLGPYSDITYDDITMEGGGVLTASGTSCNATLSFEER